MTEVTGSQKFRTVVRGSCCSYAMPWEEIVQDLQRNCSDRNVSDLPRAQEYLKYFLRVHLTVNGLDYKKHLKQVHVRPFVLLALLYFLIDQDHEVFRGKGTAIELREKMRKAVEREYPDPETHLPEEERRGYVHSSLHCGMSRHLHV